jgi:hypothetical protein
MKVGQHGRAGHRRGAGRGDQVLTGGSGSFWASWQISSPSRLQTSPVHLTIHFYNHENFGCYNWCTSIFKPRSKRLKRSYRLYYHTASNRTSLPTPPFSHRGFDLPSPFRAPGYHRSTIGDGATHLPAAPHAHPAKRCVCCECHL